MANDRLFREPGNQVTLWKLVRESAFSVTLECVESMGMVGRTQTVDLADFKKRFQEVPSNER